MNVKKMIFFNAVLFVYDYLNRKLNENCIKNDNSEKHGVWEINLLPIFLFCFYIGLFCVYSEFYENV